MNRTLLLRNVIRRASRFKLKTLGMGLGIGLGVTSTVLLQTAVGSVRDAFAAFLGRAYPADGVVLVAGTGFMGDGPGRSRLLLSDVETVANAIGAREWDPAVYVGGREIRHAGSTVSVGIAGYSEKAETVHRRSVQEGEFFTADDVKLRADVVLIGATTAAKLFVDESPIGADLFIDNRAFRVKGVLERVGVDPHGNDQDHTIWMPYTTVMETLLKRKNVAGATFSIPDRDRQEPVRKEIIEIMRERHHLVGAQEDDFSVVTPVLMQQLLDKSYQTVWIFVPVISGTLFLISLAIILSIQQISIRTRRPEIGLRMAVGARRRDLRAQILLEVLVVSLGASLVGLVLAQVGCMGAAPWLASKFGVKDVSPSILVRVIAVGSATAAGLLGAWWPARRASMLDPVAALR